MTAAEQPDFAREREARLTAEATERRLAFLFEATTALNAGPLEPTSKLVRLAQLAVPHIADWTLVDVLEDDGSLDRVAVHHWDPVRAESAQAAKGRLVHEAGEVLRAGGHEMWMGGPGQPLPDDLPAVVAQGARSVIRLPLMVPKGLAAVATLVYSESHRSHSPEDVALAQDLCARAALAFDNARLYSRAERISRVREDLMGIVSHDLKNPLSVVTMACDLLLGSARETGSKDVKHLERILRAAKRMDQLIHDLLDWSAIEAGRLTVEPHNCGVKALIAEAVESHQLAATDKRQTLSGVVGGDAPDRLMTRCDRSRALQVFSNLIGNAIKYTPAGGEISVRADPETSMIRYSVNDTGPGIDAEARAHIFDRYWQARPTGRDGVGLGLSIAAGIVHAHAGLIGVDSEPGKGSRFWFTLPRAPERK